MFTMVVNRLTERMVFEGAEQKRNKHRLLFSIDEFPSLNRMEIFADALSYMAGYGLKAYLITQDIRQIVDAYGQNESIVSNCHVRIAFAPNQVETAELLSENDRHTDRAEGQLQLLRLAILAGDGSHERQRRSHRASLMTPDEVMRLKPPQKQSDGASEKIVAPGQMLIFVSGHYPILGTQMLYFLDPELTRRAAIEPPKEFVALEDGQAIPQPPFNRTRNRSANQNFFRPFWRSQLLMPSAVSLRNLGSGKEHNTTMQMNRVEVAGFSVKTTGNPISSVRDSGSECPSGPELPLPGRQQTMAGAHKLAQPVVLRGSVGSGPRIREGRKPVRRRHD